MSRSLKFNIEERDDSFKVNRSGNSRHRLAEDKDRIRRQRKRSMKQFNDKELVQEYAQSD